MNIVLRPSTRRMVEQSQAATEALSFIEWLRAERYTDYTIDCHIRRLLFVMPRLAPGSSPPILRDRALVAAFGRERRPVAGCPPIASRPLAHAAHRLAIVLLYTAGLRRGKAARLRMEDIDAETGVVHVCGSKFHKSRWVPLSSSATRELRAYLCVRAAVIPRAAHNPMLLCSRASRGYSVEGLSSAVHGAMCRSGIWAKAPRVPRVHDFRHAFAVAALRRWYEEGRDVQSELPKLAMYMGHVSIASTTYYLRFMPAVVTLASERFASDCGDLIDDGGAA